MCSGDTLPGMASGVTPVLAAKPAAGRRLKVLVAEGYQILMQLLVLLIQDRGHEVIATHDYAAACDAFQAIHFDVVITGIHLEGGDGRQLASLSHACGISVALCTGDHDAATELTLAKVPHFQKPYQVGGLLHWLDDCASAELSAGRLPHARAANLSQAGLFR